MPSSEAAVTKHQDHLSRYKVFFITMCLCNYIIKKYFVCSGLSSQMHLVGTLQRPSPDPEPLYYVLHLWMDI